MGWEITRRGAGGFGLEGVLEPFIGIHDHVPPVLPPSAPCPAAGSLGRDLVAPPREERFVECESSTGEGGARGKRGGRHGMVFRMRRINICPKSSEGRLLLLLPSLLLLQSLHENQNSIHELVSLVPIQLLTLLQALSQGAGERAGVVIVTSLDEMAAEVEERMEPKDGIVALEEIILF
jgi:hypothetical protein